MVGIWPVFLSDGTSWLQSAQGLCLKSLKLGFQAFYNCIGVVSHIPIALTINDPIYYYTNYCNRKLQRHDALNLLILLILYTKAFLLPVNRICRWYNEKNVLFFPVFIWGKKEYQVVSWQILLCYSKLSSKIIIIISYYYYLFAPIWYLPCPSLAAGVQSCPFAAYEFAV